MRLLAHLLLMTAAWMAAARTAVIAPTAGGVWRGQARLSSHGLLLVDAQSELRKEFHPAQIRWAAFESLVHSNAVDQPGEDEKVWQEADIGRVTVQGAWEQAGGQIILRSSGLGLHGNSDSVRFIWQGLDGEGGILARVVSTHRPHPSACAGIMIRGGIGVDASMVALLYSPDQGLRLKTRSHSGGFVQVRAMGRETTPLWLMLRRRAGEVRAYTSPHGLSWTPGGSASLSLGQGALAGLVATSGQEWTANTARFDHVKVGRLLANPRYPPRAELVSGSLVVGESLDCGLDNVEVRWGLGGHSLPLRSVARLLFQWTAPRWLARAEQAGNGVWLSSGDFMEGDLRSLEQGQLRLSSVLYGTQTWDAPSEVVMVSLRKPAFVTTRYEVVTVSGSLWRAESLEFGENELVLREAALGVVRVPLHEVSSWVRR